MFGPFWAISQKLKPCDPQLYMSFKHHAKILIKLIIQLQKKSPARPMYGRTDWPYLIGTFRLPPGIQKIFISRLNQTGLKETLNEIFFEFESCCIS